ncbi:hypothetical protein JK211_07880 [Tatumella sp. JGM130]|uniref:phage baseplate plug family protein n=1 Tax=Tatumella sp. JGM130 TaxID=2799797 RepID=UPI001BAFB386|nr:hypothetical protein [Tatumella sp. JGM130]MBS0893952.1 hypothetical protein [Tatumella sp. JGM130]
MTSSVSRLPLTTENQEFDSSISGVTYKFRLLWRGEFWTLDMMDSSGDAIINGIPLVTGVDLLGQYAHLSLGFSLYVINSTGDDDPTDTTLGVTSNLYIVTE